MTAVAKYLFDVDFSQPDGGAHMAQVSMDEHQHLLDLAREQALEQGRQKGLSEARQAQAEEAEAALDGLVPALAAALDGLDDWQRTTCEDATRLAVMIGETLAGGINARDPQGHITCLIREIISELQGNAHLKISAPAGELSSIEARIETEPSLQAMSDRLTLIGDPELAPGDWRLQWANGGLQRRAEDINEQISTLLNDLLPAPAAVEAAGEPAQKEPSGEPASVAEFASDHRIQRKRANER